MYMNKYIKSVWKFEQTEKFGQKFLTPPPNTWNVNTPLMSYSPKSQEIRLTVEDKINI